MIAELRSRVLDHWNEWSLEDESPADVSLIRRLSAWQGPAGKVVYYVFRKGAHQPTLIAKTVQSAEYGETIRREAWNAFFVWERIATVMPSGMPRPVAIEEINGLPVYFEAAVPGVALPERGWRQWTDRGRLRLLERILPEAFVWLSRFTHAMPVKSCILDDEAIRTWFLNPIAQFRRRVAAWPNGMAELDRLEKIVREWKGQSIPLVAAHGDFWGGSLLYGERGLCVIDWEFFQPVALPVTDPLMLAVHPGFCVRPQYGGGLLDEFRATLADSRSSGAGYEHLMVYFDQWHVPRQWYLPLLYLFLIECSLQRDAQTKPQPHTSWADLLRYSLEAADAWSM